MYRNYVFARLVHQYPLNLLVIRWSSLVRMEEYVIVHVSDDVIVYTMTSYGLVIRCDPGFVHVYRTRHFGTAHVQ